MISESTFVIALLGGLLPALLWLFFWLREDRMHPEPRRLVMYTFVGGMLTVLLVLPLENYATLYFHGSVLFLAWAAIEEIMKFSVAYLVILRRRELEEPIDAVIYMITAALGFAAIENALFLIDPLRGGHFFSAILTGDLRFFGATLLHTLASAMIGLALALPFYRSRNTRRYAIMAGLVLAITLHTFFNFFILKYDSKILTIFAGVWVGIVLLLLLFEKVKQIKRPHFVYLRSHQ